MKCQVCKVREAENNSIVCSDRCHTVMKTIIELTSKYCPTHGCDNCWGDLGIGCTPKCREEFKNSGEFANELYALVRIGLNK